MSDNNNKMYTFTCMQLKWTHVKYLGLEFCKQRTFYMKKRIRLLISQDLKYKTINRICNRRVMFVVVCALNM